MLTRLSRNVLRLGRLPGDARRPISQALLLPDKPSLGAPRILEAVRRALSLEEAGHGVFAPVAQVEDWLSMQRGEMIGGFGVRVLMGRE